MPSPLPSKTTHLCGITKGSLSKDNGLDAVRQERCAWRSDIQSLILLHKCGLLWVEYIEDYICSYCFMHAYWCSRILDHIDYVTICVYELYNYINIISWFTANRKLRSYRRLLGSSSTRIVKTAMKTQETHLILCSLHSLGDLWLLSTKKKSFFPNKSLKKITGPPFSLQGYNLVQMVVEPTHLKNMLLKVSHFPQGLGWKFLNSWKPPPSSHS